jgi:hypothetical protein
MSRCKNELDIDFHDEWAKQSIGPSFNARKSGFITELKRPIYVPKTINKMGNPSLEKFKNKRTGIGNYDIKRLNFQAVPLYGRNVIDFEKLQLQEQAQQGIKVQLGDKTIRDLFQVQVPDSSDSQWLRIYNERKANGVSDEYQRISPPLGRPQRTVVKMVNPGQQMLNFEDKLKLLLAQSLAGAVENVNDLATITAKLTALGTNVEALSNMTRSQADTLRVVLNRVNLPITFDVFFYGRSQTRLVSGREYEANLGEINLYLLNKAPSVGMSLDKPVMGTAGNPVFLFRMTQAIKDRRVPLYLDLNPAVGPPILLSEADALTLASNGVDNGMLDGSPVQLGLPVP